MLQFQDQPGLTYILGSNYPSKLRKVHPFSHRSNHRRSAKPCKKQLPVCAGLRKLFHEYCSTSTIHGMSHIGSRRSALERFWWAAVCVLSVYGCASLIHQTYQKWDDHPVIMSFDEKPMPVWKIPFPAVTICPEAKIYTKLFNFTDTLYRYAHSGEILDQERKDRLMAVLQICDEFFHIFDEYCKLYSNHSLDVVSLLKAISITNDDTILICEHGTESCEMNFTETITEDGVCFTYNGFSSQDMFNEASLHKSHSYLSGSRRTENWSMENGYKNDSNMFSYPQRGSGTGSKLELCLTTFNEDIEAHCTEQQGYRVTLHAPDEYPMVSKKFIMLPLGKDINIGVQPQILTTSEKLRSYDSDRRQCLFNDERQLKFFRVYNQNNCEVECLINHTLEECGCVKFSMPHSEGTRICSTRELRCIFAAELNFLNDPQGISSECNCMPACSSIQYQTEVTMSTYDYQQTLNLRLTPFDRTISERTGKCQLTKLTIYFTAAQFITSQRSELYGMTDFIANCGGILGLCLGVSLFSLVELLYYIIFRPLMLMRKSIVRRKKNTVMIKQISKKRGFRLRQYPGLRWRQKGLRH